MDSQTCQAARHHALPGTMVGLPVYLPPCSAKMPLRLCPPLTACSADAHASWPRLQHLACTHNSFKGMDASSTLAPQLRQLDLSYNNLASARHLEACSQLTRLALACNQFASLQPLSGQVSRLQSLNLQVSQPPALPKQP